MSRIAKLYGVFSGSKWGMDRSKKRAIKRAKLAGPGSSVRVMPLPGPEYGSWDRPTFHALSEQIYPTDVSITLVCDPNHGHEYRIFVRAGGGLGIEDLGLSPHWYIGKNAYIIPGSEAKFKALALSKGYEVV